MKHGVCQHYVYPVAPGETDLVKYDISMVNLWTQQVTDMVLCQLVNMCQPYKWIVNCVIIEANEQA